MGLFGRKGSKVSVDSSSIASQSSQVIQSPTSARTPGANGVSSFGSGGAQIPNIEIPRPPDPNVDPAAYLRSIHAVRERARPILEKAKRNKLNHFDVDLSKFAETAGYTTSIIKRDYGPDYHSIPPHGRWQHFEVGGRPRVDQLIQLWPLSIDNQERTRRLIDLFLISVLLDAGAGTQWSYKSKENGRVYRRSEGLAVASLEMFKGGLFSSDPQQPYQVDAQALKNLSLDQISRGLQASNENALAGLEGRAGLLNRLGDAMLASPKYFGNGGRPGNMLDFLLTHPTTLASSVPIVAIPVLWEVLMDGLSPIWPASRTKISGIALGDAWPCTAMPKGPYAQPWESIVPFHKLTQWLTYSLMRPMSKIMHIQFAGVELLTALPEYRNGGLLVDTGLLTLKDADMQRGLQAYRDNAMVKGQPNMEVVPLFHPSDDVIVEWRAITVGLLDLLLDEVNGQLGLMGPDGLTLAQLLEAGTWKGGRELAEVSRPNTKAPPIMIVSDGTVF